MTAGYRTNTIPTRNETTKASVIASGDTRVFIHPGHRLQIVDAMITNFHMPRSSLLMLVSALAGEGLDELRRCIEKKFRAGLEAVELLVPYERGAVDDGTRPLAGSVFAHATRLSW